MSPLDVVSINQIIQCSYRSRDDFECRTGARYIVHNMTMIATAVRTTCSNSEF